MGFVRNLTGFVVKPFVYRSLKKRGVVHFRLERIFNDFMVDFFENEKTSLRQKLWCYKIGFTSDKILRYGLNASNYKNYLNDVDFYRRDNYKNKRFYYAYDDKLMTYFFLERYRYYLPKHYFFTSGGLVHKLDDHPYRTLSELVAGVGAIAAKKSFGRHGEGFLKFAFTNGSWSINGLAATAEQVDQKASELEDFLFTEYAENHPDLVKAAPISTMVYRVVTIYDPELGPGIVGIGARWQRKGNTLIVDQPGGVQCGVRIEDGSFFRAIDIVEKEFAEEGAPIEEYDLPEKSPYFDEMKRVVLEIAVAFKFTPHLSFDIAIVDRGPLILEINSHGMTRAIQMFHPYLKDERARRLFHTSW
jgi:hypothetical protein